MDTYITFWFICIFTATVYIAYLTRLRLLTLSKYRYGVASSLIISLHLLEGVYGVHAVQEAITEIEYNKDVILLLIESKRTAETVMRIVGKNTTRLTNLAEAIKNLDHLLSKK